MNKAMRAVAYSEATRHTYTYEDTPAGMRLVVRLPAVDGFDVVCTIEGDATDRVSHMRAEAICLALDKQLRLARNQP